MARRTSAEVQAERALIEEIRNAIETNPRAVCKAIKIIHSNQTADEQAVQATTVTNGIGFSSMDANFGSFLADVIEREGTLRGKLLVQGRKLALKYSRTQLLAVAKAKRGMK